MGRKGRGDGRKRGRGEMKNGVLEERGEKRGGRGE